jgi:hypothetical protein
MLTNSKSFPESPTLNQKFNNFKWDGTHWVCLSNAGIMVIQEDEPALPCDFPFWYKRSINKVSRQQSNWPNFKPEDVNSWK